MAKRIASVNGHLQCGAEVRSRHVCADAMLTNRTCEASTQMPSASRAFAAHKGALLL